MIIMSSLSKFIFRKFDVHSWFNISEIFGEVELSSGDDRFGGDVELIAFIGDFEESCFFASSPDWNGSNEM